MVKDKVELEQSSGRAVVSVSGAVEQLRLEESAAIVHHSESRITNAIKIITNYVPDRCVFLWVTLCLHLQDQHTYSPPQHLLLTDHFYL